MAERKTGQQIINASSDYGPLITVGITGGLGGVIGLESIPAFLPKELVSTDFSLIHNNLPFNAHVVVPLFSALVFALDEVSTFFVGSQVARAKRIGLQTFHKERAPMHPNVTISQDYAKSWKKHWKREAIIHGGIILGSAFFPPIGLVYGIGKLGGVISNTAIGVRYARAVAAERK